MLVGFQWPAMGHLRSSQGPDPRTLSDTTFSDGKASQRLRRGLIEHCSIRQGGADELLLRVTEESFKRREEIVHGSVVGDVAKVPVLALNGPIHVVLTSHLIPHTSRSLTISTAMMNTAHYGL